MWTRVIIQRSNTAQSLQMYAIIDCFKKISKRRSSSPLLSTNLKCLFLGWMTLLLRHLSYATLPSACHQPSQDGILTDSRNQIYRPLASDPGAHNQHWRSTNIRPNLIVNWATTLSNLDGYVNPLTASVDFNKISLEPSQTFYGVQRKRAKRNRTILQYLSISLS